MAANELDLDIDIASIDSQLEQMIGSIMEGATDLSLDPQTQVDAEIMAEQSDLIEQMRKQKEAEAKRDMNAAISFARNNLNAGDGTNANARKLRRT